MACQELDMVYSQSRAKEAGSARYAGE
jgi:hypothetical protein